MPREQDSGPYGLGRGRLVSGVLFGRQRRQGLLVSLRNDRHREFGGISDFRPILEKGDNFQVPERKDRQRFIAEHLTGSGGAPQVQFLREMVAGG